MSSLVAVVLSGYVDMSEENWRWEQRGRVDDDGVARRRPSS